MGPKGGLAIISACPGDMLAMSILSGDAKAISKAQGIGNKTAQRIIIELKDKINIEEMISSPQVVQETEEQGILGDAIEALTALGYSKTSAYNAVKQVKNAETMDVEELLKKALKYML